MGEEVTLVECDAVIMSYSGKMKECSEQSKKVFWRQIDHWLDLRLEIMERERAVQDSKRLEEMFSV